MYRQYSYKYSYNLIGTLEIQTINIKLQNADYPDSCINIVFKSLTEKAFESDDYLIPPSLFEVPIKLVLVDIPYCPEN